MANQIFSNAQALNHEVKIIAGTIEGGAAAPGSLSDATLTGLGFRVEKHGSEDGVITVTVDDGLYVSLMSASYTVGPGITAPTTAQVFANNLDVDGSVDLLLMQESAGDLVWVPHNLDENEQVQFVFILRTASNDVR